MATYNISLNFPPTPSSLNYQPVPQPVPQPQIHQIPQLQRPQQRPQPVRQRNNVRPNVNSNTNRRINFSNGDNLSGMIEILSYDNTPFNIDNIANNIINSLGRNNLQNSRRGLTLTEIRENTQLIVNNNDIENNICNICRDNLINNEHQHNILRKLNSCNHIFHQYCIDMWLEENSHCPTCRTSVIPTNIPDTPNTPNNRNTPNTNQINEVANDILN